MVKYFVTGASGLNGKQVAQQLLKAGAQVRVGVRDVTKAEELKKQGAEVVEFNFDKPDTIKHALAGIERLFLLAPFVEEIIAPTKATVEAAKAAGVKFILGFSAAGANPESTAHVAVQHGLADKVIKESGIDWTILEPNFFSDNFVTFATQSIKAGTVYGAAGEGKVSYVDSRDISAVASTILLHPDNHKGKTYFLSGPEALTEQEALNLIGKAIGKEIKYVSLPVEQYQNNLIGYHVPKWQAEDLAFLETVKQNGWGGGISNSVKEILGRDAIKFEAWAKDHASIFA